MLFGYSLTCRTRTPYPHGNILMESKLSKRTSHLTFQSMYFYFMVFFIQNINFQDGFVSEISSATSVSSTWSMLSSIIWHTILSKLSIALLLSCSDILVFFVILTRLSFVNECWFTKVISTWLDPFDTSLSTIIGIKSLLSDCWSVLERSGNAANASCIVSCTLSRCSRNFSATYNMNWY